MKIVEQDIEAEPTPSLRVDSSPHAAQIGSALRTVRKSKGLSVNALAKLANVSAGMISQIERNVANPSLKVIEKLRQALDVPLSALLEVDKATEVPSAIADHHAEMLIVRRLVDRPVFKVGKAFIKELLSPKGAEGLQFMTILLPPHAPPEDVVMDPGQKAGLILEGSIQLTVDQNEFVLQAGDSFQFDSTLPHSIRNDSGSYAKVLWIMWSLKMFHL
jgi:transcriptional regulator with XRE-family HTH domain